MTTFDTILGHAPDGEDVGVVRIGNDTLKMAMTNFGARMLEIEVPDRHGVMDHVLLGFARADQILKAGSFGAVLGRFANRIAGGRFTLDGHAYQLSINDPPNTLHGGKQAFSKKFWTLSERSTTSVKWSLASPDGDQGFPGALQAHATYTVEDAAVRLFLEATVDKPCPVNLSAHPYFNLAGKHALDCHDHEVEIFADRYLPTGPTQIPTGELAPVEGTVFDFRHPVRIGDRIRSSEPQMLPARGYDHCFVLDRNAGGMQRVARMSHPGSGRVLEVETDLPGLQVYTSNSLNGSLIGHGGTYRQTAGIALEAQNFPDAPNQPTFPSTVLRPGETFRSTILYHFSTR